MRELRAKTEAVIFVCRNIILKMTEEMKMETIKELRERMSTERPADWETLPDLSLYMDQVVGYMSRQLIGCTPEDKLTPAMVNNYVKDGHLPRAEGKRYSKEHLAYLTQLCALKSVLPVKEAGFLVNHGGDGDVAGQYREFCAALDTALNRAAERLTEEREDLTELALELALNSYANKLACQRILTMLDEDGELSDKKKKHKNREQ